MDKEIEKKNYDNLAYTCQHSFLQVPSMDQILLYRISNSPSTSEAKAAITGKSLLPSIDEPSHSSTTCSRNLPKLLQLAKA
ncbi:hypothetical protein H5410_023168 [Solanum commersonii]|uniref:Uncharacterized protein n=1 Tax=Solanum commersonii TaxID=4109 RepID=A0A9J5ZIK3_SOLCO|nr:hypothetical protein H5410_023168 [Solanum commersonii]